MNDGELVIHTICTLRNYEKSVIATGKHFEDDDLSTLWETFRIALFPHLSHSYLENKFREVIQADEKIPRLALQVLESSGNERVITP